MIGNGTVAAAENGGWGSDRWETRFCTHFSAESTFTEALDEVIATSAKRKQFVGLRCFLQYLEFFSLNEDSGGALLEVLGKQEDTQSLRRNFKRDFGAGSAFVARTTKTRTS